MTSVVAEFVSQQEDDAAGFIEIVQSLAVGLVREQQPKRLYIVRIDNWFGPKWLNFAGTFTAGKHASIGIHKKRLIVPPFVPSRVISERVFSAPDYMETVPSAPLHIDCSSKIALNRGMEDVDNNAVFVWFSSQSEMKRRGGAMIYSTAAFSIPAQNFGFYAGFARADDLWQPSMVRGISRNELDGLRAIGTADMSGLQPSGIFRGLLT